MAGRKEEDMIAQRRKSSHSSCNCPCHHHCSTKCPGLRNLLRLILLAPETHIHSRSFSDIAGSVLVLLGADVPTSLFDPATLPLCICVCIYICVGRPAATEPRARRVPYIPIYTRALLSANFCLDGSQDTEVPLFSPCLYRYARLFDV